MRVLVLNPPSVSAENVKRDSIYGCWCKGKRIGGAQTPPWPLLSIASTLNADGHDARVIDGQAEDLEFEAVAKDIATRDALVMMCSVMTYSEDKRVLEAVKKIKPSIKTIVCGAMGTFLPELTLKHGEGLIDVLVRREPEFIIRDLCKASGDDWKKVNGISFSEGGKAVSTPDYPLIEDMDQIPHVDWTLLSKHAQYFNPIAKRHPYRTDITTRGCYARCTYCMAPGFYGGKVRYRSADNVLELWRRHAKEGIKEIYIRDELFTCVQKRNKEICERMISEKLDLSWICSSRVGLTKEELQLFKDAGCHYIKFGVENGDQAILDVMKKGVQVEQIRETFRYCHEVGINTHAHFMIGCPGETKETIQKTVSLAKEIDPTTATFGVLTPYPGTPLFDEIAETHPEIKESLIDLEHLHAEQHFSASIHKLTADEVQDAVKRVHREFFLRPGYIWGWMKRAKVTDFPRLAKAGLNVAMFAVKGDDYAPMYRGKSIGVVVPAYNVEHLLPRVIDTMPAFVDWIIVVEDCGKDRTAAIAQERIDKGDRRVVLIRHPENRGVGAAIGTGYIWARDHGIDATAVMAGDGQMDPADLSRVLDPVVTDVADYSKGNRIFTDEWRKIPKIRLFGNSALSLMTKVASGYWHSADSQSGYTAISLEALKTIAIDKIYPRYGCPNDILVKLNIYDFRVIDVPIRPVYGIGEKSGMKIPKVVFSIGWLVTKLFCWRMLEKYIIRDFHPLVFFYLAAFLLIPVGLALGGAILFFNTPLGSAFGRLPEGWIVLCALLLISGLQSLFFAMWFDMDYNRANCIIFRRTTLAGGTRSSSSMAGPASSTPAASLPRVVESAVEPAAKE